MPRRARPKGPYPNRSDLRQTQAVATPKGQQYGKRQESERTQQAQPLQNEGAQGAQAMQMAAQMAAQAGGVPQGIVGLDAESQRPDEPLTAGLDIGAGPGSEVLPRAFADPAGEQNSRELEALRPSLPALEFMASLPEASQSSRNLVRRLRAMLPPEGGLPQGPIV